MEFYHFAILFILTSVVKAIQFKDCIKDKDWRDVMGNAIEEDITLEKLLYNIVDFTSLRFYNNVFVMVLIYNEHNMYSAASTKTYFHDFIAGMENFEDHMDGCYTFLMLTEGRMNATVFYIAKPQYNNKLNFSPPLMVQAKGLNFSDCDKDMEWKGLILNIEDASPHGLKRNTRYLAQNAMKKRNIAQSVMVLMQNKSRIGIAIEGYGSWSDWYEFITSREYCATKHNSTFYEIHVLPKKNTTRSVKQQEKNILVFIEKIVKNFSTSIFGIAQMT